MAGAETERAREGEEEGAVVCRGWCGRMQRRSSQKRTPAPGRAEEELAAERQATRGAEEHAQRQQAAAAEAAAEATAEAAAEAAAEVARSAAEAQRVLGTRKGSGNGFKGQTFFPRALQRIFFKVFSDLIFDRFWNVVSNGLGKLLEAFWGSLFGAKVVIPLRTSFKNRALHRCKFCSKL